jgi:acetolactate synthase-1/2/3 large subunit
MASRAWRRYSVRFARRADHGLFDAFWAQLKVIGARHEQACGYGLWLCALERPPGVFSVVPGPGVLNAARRC